MSEWRRFSGRGGGEKVETGVVYRLKRRSVMVRKGRVSWTVMVLLSVLAGAAGIAEAQ